MNHFKIYPLHDGGEFFYGLPASSQKVELLNHFRGGVVWVNDKKPQRKPAKALFKQQKFYRNKGLANVSVDEIVALARVFMFISSVRKIL